MAKSVEIDDRQFQLLLESMTPKRMAQAMRGAVRAAQRKATKEVLSKLKATGIRNGGGMRIALYERGGTKRGVKMGVSTIPGSNPRCYVNRYFQKKPVPLFLTASGEMPRATKSGKRKAHGTGVMARKDFMAEADKSIKAMVEQEWGETARKYAIRTAQRYGAR